MEKPDLSGIPDPDSQPPALRGGVFDLIRKAFQGHGYTVVRRMVSIQVSAPVKTEEEAEIILGEVIDVLRDVEFKDLDVRIITHGGPT